MCFAAWLLARRFPRGSVWLLWGGIGVNALVFAFNCLLAQAPAFGNMFHVMVFLPLTLPFFYLYVRSRLGYGDLLRSFAAVAAIALAGTLFMDPQADWRQMPALQSPWFVPHVLAYLISYALLAVAALRTLQAFREERRAAQMEQACALARLSFGFLTFGLCSGALWADEVWGGCWSWDIKEVWALITWSLYLAYFHLSKESQIGRGGRALLLFAFAALLFTFFVVNWLPRIESLHSYAS